MATRHHNVTGELTKELLAPGDDVKVTSISFANVQSASLPCSVDLFIQKKLTGKFYFFKQLNLPGDVSFIYKPPSFRNTIDAFGLYVKLTKSASETPAVDVIIT